MKRYNFSADLVRVFAIAGVVAIHTANSVFARPDFVGGTSWWFALVVNSVSRPAIPLFILVSGYFLLAKDEPYGAALRRTWSRLGIPFLFWFLADVLWNHPGQTLGYWRLQPVLIRRLFTVNVFDLYFFVILIGLYAVAPVLRAYLSRRDAVGKRRFGNTLLVFGVALFACEYLFSLCSPANSLTYWVPYTGLFVAGYVLGHTDQIRKLSVFLLYLGGLAVTVAGGYAYFYLTAHGNNVLGSHGCLTMYSDSYLSVNVVAMAVASFVFLMHTDFSWVPNIIKKLIFSIARNTLGIYVLHTFVIDILDYWHVFSFSMPLVVYIILRWFVVFTLAYIYSLIFTRIPVIRRVFGETKRAT